MTDRRRTWIEVDLVTIRENFRRIKQRLGASAGVMAVVKANASGLGMVPVALALEQAGCDFFAVAVFEEALTLRQAGIRSRILLMAPVFGPELRQAMEQNVEVAVIGRSEAAAYSEEARARGGTLRVHIKFDVGLSRLGIQARGRAEEAAKEAMEIATLPGLDVRGVFCHITAGRTPEGDALNREELETFSRIVEILRLNGLRPAAHCLSSTPAQLYPDYAYDYVRPGDLLFGLREGRYEGFGDIRSAISLRTRIIQIKEVPPGTPVSYGPLYVTDRVTRIATVPVGFADGLRRDLSNRGHLLLWGRQAPIIGKICSDFTMLDVTDIPEVRVGDVATIIGKDGAKSQYAGDLAALTGASAGEITTALSARLPRCYLDGGERSALAGNAAKNEVGGET